MAITLYHTAKSRLDTTISALEVTAIHSTQDMSVANSTKFTNFYPYREVESMVGKSGVSPISECAPWRIISASNDEVVIEWQRKQYTVKVGETIHTESYAIDNPYLSWEGISLSLKYERVNVWEEIISEFEHIYDEHRSRPTLVTNRQDIKQRCLKLMYELIVTGEKALQPIYAWIVASKNWSTLIISDYNSLKKTLKPLPSVDDPQLNAWLENFAQILRHNPQEKVLNSVPGLRAMLQEAAQLEYEIASDILNGQIVFQQLSERQNPDCKELILNLKVINDIEDTPLSYIYVTKEFQNVGQKIELGEYGDVEIREVGSDYIILSWHGKECKVRCNYLIYTLDANPNEVSSDDYAMGYEDEMKLACTLTKENLWSVAKREINRVIVDLNLPSMSSSEEIEQHSNEAKSLIKILIARGDSELESLYNDLCNSNDWRELEDSKFL